MYRASSPYRQANVPPRAYSPQPPAAYSPQLQAYSPQPNAYSPQPQMYPPQQAQAFPQSSTPGSQIVAGSVTYTTSTGPDGRITYNIFRAVPASYQTPNGVVSGIQWIPAETSNVAPTNAQPVSPELAASWSRNYLGKEDKLKEWQREEEKRRKQEEKESAKRLREQQELRNDDRVREYERERRKSFNSGTHSVPFPLGAIGRSTSPYMTYVDPAISGTPQYTNQGSVGNVYGRERKRSNASGIDALSRQIDDLDLNRPKERERKVSGLTGRPRKYSTNAGDERPELYASPYMRQGDTGPYGAPNTPGYVTSVGKYSPNRNPSGLPVVPSMPYNDFGKYSPNAPNAGPSGGELPFIPPYPPGSATSLGKYSPNPPNRNLSGELRGSSPAPYAYPSSTRTNDLNARSSSPYGTSGGAQPQVYPRGHVMEGQLIRTSRAPSPSLGARPGSSFYSQNYASFNETPVGRSRSRPPSPRIDSASSRVLGGSPEQLPPPEGFSRPIDRRLEFAAFDTMKIQNMDEFILATHPPRIPLVLKSHDVETRDWQRLMSDITLAWSGRLPIPRDSRSGQPPRRTTVVADMLDLWNTSFFLPRGVEIILYKGRERRSGPKVGFIDESLPNDDEDDSDQSESEEEDDESEFEGYLARNANTYGRPQDFDPVIIAKRRREAREARRRQRKEKEAKRRARAKEKEKIYALCMTNVSGIGSVHSSGMPGGYPPAAPPAYASSVGSYGRRPGY